VQVQVGPGGSFTFSPATVNIAAGDAVRWVFPSSLAHSTTSGSNTTADGIWDSGVVSSSGASFTHTFTTAGSFAYFCSVHGSCCHMVGTVNVAAAATPTPTPTPTPVATPTPTPSVTPSGTPRLSNISTRGVVGTGDNVQIGGFIVNGAAAKKVLIRAIGPSLSQFGVPGALTDPIVSLFDSSSQTIAQNDDWQTTQTGGVITQDQTADIMASGKAPADPHESAIIATLAPAAYTAIVRGKNNSSGVGLIEVFDLDSSVDSELANISTRGQVLTADNVMIGGFIVDGGSSKKVLIRATGPSLANFGVAGALGDTTVTLFDSNGQNIGQNDDWPLTQLGGVITSDQVAPIMNSGHPPTDNHEAAIIATLAPGSYTAIVRGKDSTTGVGLVEIFEIP
jgi:plastocyanin